MLFGAATALLGLVAIGLTVDLARLYHAQRQLQSAANMAALDAARVAGGCFGREAIAADPLAAARREALDALERNRVSRSWLEGGGLRLGRMARDGSLRSFSPLEAPLPGAIGPFNAVELRLTRDQPSRLIPGFNEAGAQGALTAVAAAISRPAARFGVGSGLASVSLPDSVLNDLISAALGGPSPEISLVSYRNLFDATVTVGTLELLLTPGTAASTLDQLISSQGLLITLADALGAAGEAAAAETAAALAAVAGNAPPVVPAELIGLQDGIQEIAGSILINAGVLVNQLLRESARGTVQTIPITIPCPLGPCEGSLTILDPGNDATATPVLIESMESDRTAQTAQIRFELLGLEVPVAGLGRLAVDVTVEAAPATAQVVDIRCPRAGALDGEVTLLGRTGLATATVRVSGDLNGLLSVVSQPAPILLGQTLSNPVPLVFRGPFDAETGEPAQRLGSSSYSSLAGALESVVLSPADLQLSVAGVQLPVEGLLGVGGAVVGPALENLVRGELAGVLAQVGNQLEPVLGALGIQLGYADFRVYAITDAQPALFLR